MQVLSRRENESVEIGDDVTVTVLEIGYEHVRLGISCPSHDPEYWEQTLFTEESPAELQFS